MHDIHDLRITTATQNMGIIIQCYRCPEANAADSDYEWVDSDDTVYFSGTTVNHLVRFIECHPTANTREIAVPPF